jgi:predicted ATPase/class 3 adenylate cyclase
VADTAPTGIITLMFTDIQDSTLLWERMSDQFRPVLDRHNELVRECTQRWEGYEVKSHGDSFMLAFERATDAIQCALEIQRAFHNQQWPPEVGELLVRVGLHTGDPFLGFDSAGRCDYFGPTVNRAARIAEAGHGGQTLLSSATRDILQGALSGDLQLDHLGSHRLRGLEQSEHLFELRHPDLPRRRFPPLRSLDTLRTNLPMHPTTFVGREQELAELQELLIKPETRLLTITGPGGSGKTRLAHEAASDSAGRFADGVWLVSLADIHEPDNVLPEIAAAVRLPLLTRADAREQLIAFLNERSLLLLLDNFEHVIGASLLLADILRSAPHVKCLVTSQIALRLRGERVYGLAPMRTPDPDALAPDNLLRFDSVTLFLERARAARSDFALTSQNAPVVTAICRKLEGVPLAIELAAAQVGEMSVVEVLEGLESQASPLLSESPDLPERHRTLTAAIDWSYRLLDPSEQAALQQLSVFAGGCSRDAVQAVSGKEGLTALSILHRHSLVHPTETESGRTRYLLLAMVREYARRKLAENPTAARELADRHARYYLGYAEERIALMRTREELRALDELGEELDNLRVAMGWAEENEHAELCARLAVALYEPLYRRGFWEEAYWRLQSGFTAAKRLGARHLLAAMEYHRASLAHDRGDPVAALNHGEASLAFQRDLDNREGIAQALNLLGYLAIEAGDTDASKQHLGEALQLLTDQDHALRGMVLHNQALRASRCGNHDAAQHLYEEALTCQRTAGDLHHQAETLGNLGALAHNAGGLAGARRLYAESLALRRTLRDRWGIAVMLNNLGELAEANRDEAAAIALFVHAERIFRELQSALVTVPANSLQRLADKLGPERWVELRAIAEQKGWEEVVDSSIGRGRPLHS